MTSSGIYLGLLVYGAGALALSLFGALGHGHDESHDDGGHDSGHDGGHDGGHDSGHDGGHDAAHDHGHDAAHDHGHDAGRGHSAGGTSSAEGAITAAGRGRRGDEGTRAVSRIAAFIRSTVYLSLGAGATGLFAAARDLGALEGAAWAAGAGVLALAVARLARRLVRRDLDSSFKGEEFLMEEGVIVVPAAPGEMGKAEVRKYGASVELYVRASVGSIALAKGDRVRVVDFGDECYFVEPVRDAAGDQEA
jgi:membrane protein implicated in regulation of membrane protease activity